MSRPVKFREPAQPTRPFGHGTVQWDTLPDPVREQVLALWTQLLTAHITATAGPPNAGTVAPAADREADR